MTNNCKQLFTRKNCLEQWKWNSKFFYFLEIVFMARNWYGNILKMKFSPLVRFKIWLRSSGLFGVTIDTSSNYKNVKIFWQKIQKFAIMTLNGIHFPVATFQKTFVGHWQQQHIRLKALWMKVRDAKVRYERSFKYRPEWSMNPWLRWKRAKHLGHLGSSTISRRTDQGLVS